MIEIALKDIQKFYGANQILSDVTFEVQTGEIVGVVGLNGCGKTTVFKIISGIEKYDAGSLSIRKNASIGYLDQIPVFSDGFTVIDVLHEVFKEIFLIEKNIHDIEREMPSLSGSQLSSAMKKYGELQHLFEHRDGYKIQEKINRICTGLKISQAMRTRNFNTLSGGEKTTVVLAKMLLQNPDILLLDEPSNHLDMESIEWLEDFLKEYKGTVLIISHDRYFLDRLATKTIEIEDGQAQTYHGNYTFYQEEKERKLLEQFENYENQQKKIAALEQAIKDLKDWGNRSGNPKFFKRAASMQKRLDRIDKIDKPKLERTKIKLDFSSSGRTGKEVIAIHKLSKSFKDKHVLNNIDFLVEFGERVAIIGRNGSGKSTLIKIILGMLGADDGEVIIGSNTKIGYLPQEVVFEDENSTVLDTFRHDFTMSEETAHNILAKFLFFGQDVFKKVKSLSGGEKSRLRLAQLMHHDINVLILDEPTNHLDIDSKEMLEEALINFEGTIIFISHDRYFINRIASMTCELNNASLKSYNGNYDYYREKRVWDEVKNDSSKEDSKKPQNVKEKPKGFSKNKLKYIEQLESDISGLEEQIRHKDFEMAENAANYDKLKSIMDEKQILQEKLDRLMSEWIDLLESSNSNS